MRDTGADPSSPPARCCPQARGRQLLRRQLLRRSLALPLAPLLLGSAATSRGASLPDVPDGPGSSSARDRLAESAAAHGLAAWLGLHDINAGFSQLWLPASGWRPASADAAGSVQLRLLPASGVAALQPAAAGSAEAMRLLLLGPLAVHGIAGAVNWGPPDTLDDRRCDQLLLAWPGAAGAGAGNRLALFIDRDEGLLRRLRLAPDAPGSLWGRLAEVDFFDHFSQHGVVWPRRFQSPSLSPSLWPWPWPGARPQAASLTGLDVNRGYGAPAIATEPWAGEAALPARPLPAV